MLLAGRPTWCLPKLLGWKSAFSNTETILKACFESVSFSGTTSFCTLNAHRHFLCVRSWGGHLELQLWAAHLRTAVRLGYNYSQGKLSKLQCKADPSWKTKQTLERTNLCEFAWITLWLSAVVCVSWVHRPGKVNLSRVCRSTLVVHYQVKEQQRSSTNTPVGECVCPLLRERASVLISSVNELNGCTQI